MQNCVWSAWQKAYLWRPMKKALFALLVACLCWSACSNDFEVNADWKEFGIVYGLLDLASPQQYVRVNKAFLDDIEPIQSATEIAGASADSIYFSDNIQVWLDEFNANNNFVRKIDLGRVSAAAEGLPPKEEGLFNNSDYYVYTAPEVIKTGHSYEVNVVTDQGTTLHSRTSLADDFDVTLPVVTLENPALSNDYEMAAFDVIGLAWTRSGNAVIYDVTMTVNIQEFNSVNPSVAEANYNIHWDLASNIIDDQPNSFSTLQLDFQYESFLEFLQNSLDPNPAVFRTINHIDIRISAGTEELKLFRDVSLSAGSNLNAGQAKPIYSNVENGFGLFASVNSTTRRVLRLSNNTKTDIACNPITADLNFSPNYENLFEPCP